MASSLGHLPRGRWEFDEDVTRVFDDMLRRSIPEYETMRRLVHEVGRSFIQPGTDVVDLGCSRGEALAPFMREARPDVRYIGVDVSQPMLEATCRRFGRELENGMLELLELDLRDAYPAVSASLTLSVLTLQFIAFERRVSLLRDIYEHTVEGGALILVEKVLGKSAELDGNFVRLYHDFKRSSGYSQE